MNEENELIKEYIELTEKVKQLEFEKQKLWNDLIELGNNKGTLVYKIGKARGLK